MKRKILNLPVWVYPVVGIVVVLAIGGVLWLPHYTTSSASYCLTCHGTGETPDKSKSSSVHPSYAEVSCVDCHAKPGQPIITEGYRGGFSADPALVSSNCRRCHEDVVKNKDVDAKFNPLGIKIPHKEVPEEVFLQCTNCHRDIAHDLSNPATNRPHREYCYECHSEQESCSKCHTGNVPQIPPTPHPGGEKDGRTLYSQYCALCHGSGGNQLPGVNLGSKEFLDSRGDTSLAGSIAQGVTGMPAYGKEKGGPLSPEGIQAIISWLHSRGE